MPGHGLPADACLSITGAKRLCMAGGVAMNCVSIGKVIAEGLFEEVYVPPGMSARQVTEPARFLAAQLAEGKIAGLFQGRLEAGPRALGNGRSSRPRSRRTSPPG